MLTSHDAHRRRSVARGSPEPAAPNTFGRVGLLSVLLEVLDHWQRQINVGAINLDAWLERFRIWRLRACGRESTAPEQGGQELALAQRSPVDNNPIRHTRQCISRSRAIRTFPVPMGIIIASRRPTASTMKMRHGDNAGPARIANTPITDRRDQVTRAECSSATHLTPGITTVPGGPVSTTSTVTSASSPAASVSAVGMNAPRTVAR